MNPGLQCINSACLRQSLYLLDGGGVVYSETENRFVGLNAAGVSAYRAFAEGADVRSLRECCDEHNFSSPGADGLDVIHALSQGIFPDENPREEWPLLEQPRNANIEIHGIPVLLEWPTGPLEDLCRDYFRNCLATTRLARCHLHAQPGDGGWTIRVNGHAFLSQLRDEQLGLGFLHAARSLLYAEAKYDVAFHAAMVADDNQGILLCAPRESGKSTLTASLVARGFNLLTDEPALLHLDTSAVSSLLLPVSLKEGSWEILHREWPQLKEAPVHMRSDGVRLRLLHPPQMRFSARPQRLTHFVFPEYNPSLPAHVEQLSPLRTLGLLNEGGMILAKHIDRVRFEAFLNLVCITPAHTIRYASLEEAIQILPQISIEDSII